MNRRSVSLALATATLAMTAAACVQTTQGQAAPGTRVSTPVADPTTTARSPARPTTSRPGADGPLAGTEPCDLVSESDRAELGLKSTPTTKSVAYGRGCQFAETDAGYFTGVAIFDALGPDKTVAGATDRKSIAPIGRHQTEQWMFAHACTFSMTISPTSTVDVSASVIRVDDKRSCELATDMARLVEPKLP